MRAVELSASKFDKAESPEALEKVEKIRKQLTDGAKMVHDYLKGG